MASTAQAGQRDYLKWAFFALMALCTLTVIGVDERFLVISADPEWQHIEAFKWLLLVHGICGATALACGPFQFSDTMRRTHPAWHRWNGRVYIGAVTVASLFAGYIGPHFEPQSIRIEQYFQAGGWFLCTAVALWFVLRRNFVSHKLWMMRSYGFCLVFLMSRVPDAVPGFHWSDQLLADVLWGLVIAALVGPDLILAVRGAMRKRAA
jgi:hypothetical protein